MKDFTYDPLEESKAQIRLVHLVPLNRASEQDGWQQPELHCSIQTVSLHDEPEYTALSYTWGTQNRISQLIVDGDTDDPTSSETAIRITSSLETALVNLRHPTERVTLWIDQLCINQNNIEEKNSQVPLMKVIYEKARNVLVWLGPSTAETDDLLKILNEIGKQTTRVQRLYHETSTSALRYAFNVSLLQLRKRRSLGPRFTIPTESLRSFVELPWWSRVWVVQEISLASSVVFVCGAQRITYDYLRNALQFYALDIWKKFEDYQGRHWLVTLSAIRTIMALEKAPFNSPASRMLSSSYKYKCQKESSGGHSLLRILELSHVVEDPKNAFRLQATDGRDKIYGLLGLANDADKLRIRPDYGKELPNVFLDVARALLESGQVDLLWFCQFPKSEDGLNLPTWAPDWNGFIKTPYGSDFSLTSRPFAASGDAKADVSILDKGERCITLQGVLVDEVDVVGRVWEEALGSGTQQAGLKQTEIFLSKGFHIKTVIPFIEDLNLFFDEALSKGSVVDPSVIEEARWRTPIGDKEWEDKTVGARRATTQSREVYSELCRRIEIQKSKPVLTKRPQKRRFALLRVLCFLLWMFLRFLFMRLYRLVLMQKVSAKTDNSIVFPDGRGGLSYMTFMKQMYGRRPFRMQNGYVGLGPAHMTKGDIVCIILGAQVPYVLRPDVKGRYQLIGEAYIHGIMDGEFMEKKVLAVDLTLC